MKNIGIKFNIIMALAIFFLGCAFIVPGNAEAAKEKRAPRATEAADSSSAEPAVIGQNITEDVLAAATSSSATSTPATAEPEPKADDKDKGSKNDDALPDGSSIINSTNVPATSTDDFPPVAATSTPVATAKATTTRSTSSVYTTIQKTPPSETVITPYSAVGILNTFLPSEGYPSKGLGRVESAALTFGAVVSAAFGALMIGGKALLFA